MSKSKQYFECEYVSLNPLDNRGYGLAISLGAQVAGFEGGDDIEVMPDPESGNPPDLFVLQSPEETERSRQLEERNSHVNIRVPPTVARIYTDEGGTKADRDNPPLFKPMAEEGAILLEYAGRAQELAQTLYPDDWDDVEDAEEGDDRVVDEGAINIAANTTGESHFDVESAIEDVTDAALEADALGTVTEYPPVELEEIDSKIVFVPTEAFRELATNSGVDQDLLDAIELGLTCGVEDTLEEHGKTEYRGFDRVAVPVVLSR